MEEKKTFHSIHLAFLSVCACPQKRELRRRSKCIPEHALRTSGIHFGYPRSVAEPDLVSPSPVGKVPLIGTKAIGEDSLPAPRPAAPAPWRLVLPACANQVRLANSNACIFHFCFLFEFTPTRRHHGTNALLPPFLFPLVFFFSFTLLFFPSSFPFCFLACFTLGKQTKPPPTTTFGFAQLHHLNF